MVVEKRRFPRADIVCKISAAFGERMLTFDTHTENIGEGGIRVILKEKLNIPTSVGIELYLQEREVAIRCQGEIVWTHEMKPAEVKPHLFDTGIKFVEISDGDRGIIREVVSSLIGQEGVSE
jgi:hypothetical protein